MKYLITGGCGFFGANISAKLLSLGETVYIFDNLSRTGSANNLKWLESLGCIKFIYGDIRNLNDVEIMVKSLLPDVIIHLAGQVAMTVSITDPRKDFEINVLGTINILESVRNYCPDTIIIYSSSNKVYGDLNKLDLVEEELRYTPKISISGINETAPIEFHTPYGCSKGAADQYVLDYARCYSLRTVVFRHSTIYGGRQYATFDQGWIGWFCMQALLLKSGASNSAFTISGNGKQVRDLLYVDDAVNCYLKAVNSIETIRGKVFNLGGGLENSSSLLELFKNLEILLSIKLIYTKNPWRLDDQKYFVADNSLVTKYLNWKPNVNKSIGLQRILEWTNNDRISNHVSTASTHAHTSEVFTNL